MQLAFAWAHCDSAVPSSAAVARMQSGGARGAANSVRAGVLEWMVKGAGQEQVRAGSQFQCQYQCMLPLRLDSIRSLPVPWCKALAAMAGGHAPSAGSAVQCHASKHAACLVGLSVHVSDGCATLPPPSLPLQMQLYRDRIQPLLQ